MNSGKKFKTLKKFRKYDSDGYYVSAYGSKRINELDWILHHVDREII
jgi:hypothetical protein